jgi:hypothetical protein
MRHSRIIPIALLLSVVALGACSDKGGGGLAAFCETHTDPALENLDPSDPEGAEKLSAAMEKMEDNAPAEIKEDVATTRAGYEAAASGDVAAITEIDVEEFQAAAQRVQEYAEENCT